MNRKVLIAAGIVTVGVVLLTVLSRSKSGVVSDSPFVVSPKLPARNVFTWTIGQGAQPPVAPTMTRPGPPGGFSGQTGQAVSALQTGAGAVDTLLNSARDFVDAFRS